VDVGFLFKRANEAFERKNYEYSAKLCLDVLEAQPENLEVRKLYHDAIRMRKGITSRSKGASHFSLRYIFGSIAANFLLLIGKPRKALNKAQKMLFDDPLNIGILKIIAKGARNLGMPYAAIYELEKAREINSRNTYVLRQLARLYVSINELKRASERFGELKDIVPHDEEASRGLQDYAALDTIQDGKWAEGESFVNKVKDLEEARMLHDELKKVRSDDDVLRQIEIFEKKVEESPDGLSNYLDLSALYLRAKMYEKAQKLVERGLEKDPDNFELLAKKGDIEIQRIADDLTELEKEVKANPNEDNKKKLTQKRAQLLDVQTREFRKRVELHPTDPILRYRFGEIMYRAKKYDEAIEHLQKTIGDLRTQQSAYNLLGLCFRKKGLLDYAAEQFLKALKGTVVINEKAKAIIYNLAMTYEDLGNFAAAEEQYKRIYEVDIGYRDIANKINAIYKKVREKKQSPDKKGESQ